MSDSDKMRAELGEYLRRMILYNPETGDLVWKERPAMRIKAGTLAGNINSGGYLSVQVKGKKRPAHRIAWFLYYGTWPKNDIDHINGIKTDNRIVNLRDVASVVNFQNQRKPRKNNKSGFLGVSKKGNRWVAQIQVDGRRTHLGSFEKPEDAYASFLEARRKFYLGNTL